MENSESKSEKGESKERNLIISEKSAAKENEPGRKNQDAIFSDKEKGIAAVFDGLGGHNAGEVASGTAMDFIEIRMENINDNLEPEKIKEKIETILKQADEAVKNTAEYREDCKGMGTTASVIKIWESQDKTEKKVIIGNVGDSRVYILRANGDLEQITIDDGNLRNLTSDEKELRLLQEEFSNALSDDDFTEQELSNRIKLTKENKTDLFKGRRAVSQMLGSGKVKPRMHIVDLKEGEKIIITSDGVHDNLTAKEMKEELNKGESNAESLVEAARERSKDPGHFRAKEDDVSAIVIEYEKSKLEQRPEPEPEDKAPFTEEEISQMRADSFKEEREAQMKVEEQYQKAYHDALTPEAGTAAPEAGVGGEPPEKLPPVETALLPEEEPEIKRTIEARKNREKEREKALKTWKKLGAISKKTGVGIAIAAGIVSAMAWKLGMKEGWRAFKLFSIDMMSRLTGRGPKISMFDYVSAEFPGGFWSFRPTWPRARAHGTETKKEEL